MYSGRYENITEFVSYFEVLKGSLCRMNCFMLKNVTCGTISLMSAYVFLKSSLL